MEYKKAYQETEIIQNLKIAKDVFKITLKGKFEGAPGQFYMLRKEGSEPYLSRPLSIADKTENTITFLYLVTGKGTKLFSTLKMGDTISILGPLGTGFKIENYKKIAVISGGIGIAPMLYLLKALPEKVDFYAGFRDYDYYLEELKPYTKSIKISSDTGKVGQKGTVLNIIETKDYDQIYVCGPEPMLKAVSKILPTEKTQLSLENKMACGLGACLGCTCKTKNGMERVCVEGPVFIASEVEDYA